MALSLCAFQTNFSTQKWTDTLCWARRLCKTTSLRNQPHGQQLYDMHTIENGVKFCETRSKSYMGRTFLPIVICHLAIFPPGRWKFVKTTLFRTSTYQHLHKKCYTRSGHNQHDHDFSIVQHGSRYLRKCCKIQEIAIFEVYSLKLPA